MIGRLSQLGGVWLGRPGFGLSASLIALVAIFAILSPEFLHIDNLVGVVHRVTTTGIMAVGMTFVIMTGGIDLTVGPVLAISGLVAFFTFEGSASVPLSVLGAIGTGAAIGALNGAAVAYLRLPPIIVTLAMLSIVRGTALIVGGPILHQLPEGAGYEFIGTGFLFGVPVSVWIFLALAMLTAFVQRRSAFGLEVAAVGDNERAAFLSGRPVRLVKTLTYVICGATAALAGLIQSSQVYTASANFGEFGTELDVIAAVVLGGTSLQGGRGSILGTVMGVLFLGVVSSGLNILDVPVDVQLIAKGLIIVGALSARAGTQGQI
ncbi:MAG: ABC transporter permease [Bradyrhizobium sp.]|nr:MAG: ABC transporter permease [Bradyrhizobium sp.]